MDNDFDVKNRELSFIARNLDVKDIISLNKNKYIDEKQLSYILYCNSVMRKEYELLLNEYNHLKERK